MRAQSATARRHRGIAPKLAWVALLAALGALGALVLPSRAAASHPPPSWSEYHGSRAVALAWRALLEQRPVDAARHAATAVALLPDSAEAWQVETRAAMGSGDWTRAERGVHALRRLDAASPSGLELLGRISVERGDAESADAAFEALDGLLPAAANGQLGLALVNARLRRAPAAALGHLARARSRDPTLDLSTLLLRPEWASLAGDPAFVEALTTLLRPASAAPQASPSADGGAGAALPSAERESPTAADRGGAP